MIIPTSQEFIRLHAENENLKKAGEEMARLIKRGLNDWRDEAESDWYQDMKRACAVWGECSKP